MTERAWTARARSFLRRLPVQLTALLTLALFPLGLISLYQTGQVIEEARHLNRASLMERTVAAGTEERATIQKALGAGQALGLAVLSVPVGECTSVLTRFVSADETYLSANYHGPDGRVICRSADDAPAATTGIAIAPDATDVSIRPAGAEGGLAVIRVSHPIHEGGAFVGFVSIAVPLRLPDTAIGEDGKGDPLHLAVINRDGEVLATSRRPDDAGVLLPAAIGMRALFDLQGSTFDSVTASGEDRVFAVSSMIEGQAALVGSWPQRGALASGWAFETLAPMVLPVLMWLTGMFVAFFGLQRLVIRHVSALRSAMRRYALGELHAGRLELDNPPEELLETGRAFNRMVLLLAQAEAQQEQDLRDKEVLLREVHHRVKNNLQLIGSIMNMQARAARTPEARRILDSLRSRVRGLATVHRTLYTTPTMTTVEASELVRTLVNDITSVSDDTALAVDVHVDTVDLFPDQAVPLSMLLAETLTNAVKYLGTPKDGPARIEVGLTAGGDGSVTLTIQNTTAPDADDAGKDQPGGDGLGTRLIRAFEQQIGGRSQVHEDGTVYRYTLSFTRRDFEAESLARAG